MIKVQLFDFNDKEYNFYVDCSIDSFVEETLTSKKIGAAIPEEVTGLVESEAKIYSVQELKDFLNTLPQCPDCDCEQCVN